jgi:protein tyrosine/serine phosphatase
MTNAEKQNKEAPTRTKIITLHRIGFFLACLIIIVLACKCPEINQFRNFIFDANRPDNSYVRIINNPNWAQKLDLPGLPNLHKVSDDLYRGAQPTAEGMKELEKLGIKTVVNLRSLHSDRDEMEDANLTYEHIRMTTLDVDMDDIISFLNIVTDSNSTPVFVHCQYGADRTGTMCAIYRVIIQNWSREDAVEEMTQGGYGFHPIWDNLADYIRELDTDEIKQKVLPAEKADAS